jgi:glycosyltransferase involved in cell wall biosynthesis
VKVLLLSTYDTWLGAAKATYRLHQGLLRQGLDSWMLVNKKFSADARVIAPTTAPGLAIAQMRARLEQWPLRFYPQRQTEYYSLQWLPDGLAPKVAEINPDVINVHWVQGGFMQLETLARFQKPIVLTLHDLWAITGGCHYSQGCEKYQQRCGACPQLGSAKEKDFSRWLWHRKQRSWQKLNLTVVALSRWLKGCVASSPLLQSYPLHLIANGLDLQTYAPLDKTLARQILGLSPHRQVILFGSADGSQRKGFHHLKAALAHLRQTSWGDRVQLLIFGQHPGAVEPDWGLPSRYLGFLHDDLSLRLVYACADVFVAPSQEDNLPNTVLEASACGTPSVAFHIGGMPDLIEHQVTGYLATPLEAEDLCAGILWVLEQSQESSHLGSQARLKAEAEFSQLRQAQAYQKLFELLTPHP